MFIWLLSIALVVLAYFVYRHRISALVRPRGYEPVTLDVTPDTPSSFGFKNSWLAIRADKTEEVVAALLVQESKRANWRTGVAAAYQAGVFVSPPIDGWVLVASQEIPGLGSDTDPARWGKTLTPLATEFSELQYFTSHRVVDYHAWARFEHGELTRAFAWLGESGEVLEDFGNPTDEEIELGFEAFASTGEDEEAWDNDDYRAPTETDVMNLAGLWSVDPTELHLRTEEGSGWYSESSHFDG